MVYYPLELRWLYIHLCYFKKGSDFSLTKREIKASRILLYIKRLSFEIMFSFFILTIIGKSSTFTLIGSLTNLIILGSVVLMISVIDKRATQRRLNKMPLIGKNGELVNIYCVQVSMGDKSVHETILCAAEKLPFMVGKALERLNPAAPGTKYKVTYGNCNKCKLYLCDEPKKGEHTPKKRP